MRDDDPVADLGAPPWPGEEKLRKLPSRTTDATRSWGRDLGRAPGCCASRRTTPLGDPARRPVAGVRVWKAKFRSQKRRMVISCRFRARLATGVSSSRARAS